MDKTWDIGINMTLEFIKTAGAIAASLMAIGAFFGGIWWLARRIVKIAEAVQQLRPNGGSSLADKVNKIAEVQTTMVKTVDTLVSEVEKLKVFDTEVAEALTEKKGRRR